MAIDNKELILQRKLKQITRSEEEIKAESLAKQLGLPYVDLSLTPIDADDLFILPQEESNKAQVVIIAKTGKVLRLGVVNPQKPKAEQTINDLKGQGYECKIFIISVSSLLKASRGYNRPKVKSVPLQGVFILEKKELDNFKSSVKTIDDLKKAISNISTTQLLSVVIAGSIEMESSDIHVEPTKDGIRLRYRIDGMLQDIANFPEKAYRFFVSRIKTLSEMLLNVTDITQDGRFTIRVVTENDEKVKDMEVRVSILPTGYGETIVMRVLGIGTVALDISEIGLHPSLLEVLKKEIARPNGMILNTGPTGSGKTTTLYSCLNHLNRPGNKIITVEDPVEYKLEGITQTQISKRKGQDFSQALKAIVRQDPDVLMVGEIRDKESADIAIHFALTGHFVLSTLHTNDAPGAIPRLTDMGVDPRFIPSSLNLVIAQRLVRKLCPDCKEAYEAPVEKIEIAKKIFSLVSPKSGFDIPRNIKTFYKAKGCPKCKGLGYKGRIPVFEFFYLSDAIQKMILKGATSHELMAKAMDEGMVTLLQDGLIKAANGETSLEEVERVIGSPEYIERIYGKAVMSMLSRSLKITQEAWDWAQALIK